MKVTFDKCCGVIQFTGSNGNQVNLPERFLALVDGLLVVAVRVRHNAGNGGHGMGQMMEESITFTNIGKGCSAVSMDEQAKIKGFELLGEDMK